MTKTTTTARAASTKAGLLVACVGAGCAALLSPFVASWESGGKPRLTAYRDIVGVWTICDGDTKGVARGHTETVEGCAIRLDKRLADHAAPVLACTPALRGHDPQLAASISLAYNIGTGAWCKSTADRAFDAHRWRAGCDALLLFNKAGGRVVKGLVRRRAAERALCLTDLPN